MKLTWPWWVVWLLMVASLGACSSSAELEPQIILITATPETEMVSMAQQASPSPIPASATPFPTLTVNVFPTITPTALGQVAPTVLPSLPNPNPDLNAISPFPSLTLPPGVTASPTATITPTRFVPASDGLDPNVEPDAAGLPVFPSGTPTATIEGIPAPTEATSQNPRLPTPDGDISPPDAISDQAPPPEALPILEADSIGIQVHPFVTNEEWERTLNLSRQLKIDWIKFQIPWEVAETTPGNFSFQYERLVLLVQQAHLRDFKVLISINRAPDWARPPEADLNQEGPPADPNALAGFITRLIQDIKPEFMEAIEIWNEPNLIREWQGVPMDGATYMRYFEAGYNAARAADPEIFVVTAGLAPVGTVDGARDDRAFLREMYAAGLDNFPQARLGVHPYGWANPPDATCCSDQPWGDAPQFFMLDTIQDYRDIMLENNDPNRRMWLTEFGWGTFQAIRADGSDGTPPVEAQFMGDITVIEQAEYTLRALELMQTPDYDYIELRFIWNLNFATIEGIVDNQVELAGYSLLDAGGNPRPLFYYLLNTRKIYE